MKFGAHVLAIDCAAEVARIVEFIRENLRRVLRKKGLVVAVSGGVDSSVTLTLAVKAVGPERVFALMLPERESDPMSLTMAKQLVDGLHVPHAVVDISAMLAAAGCYEARDAVIREVYADFRPDWKSKILLGGVGCSGPRLNYYLLQTEEVNGNRRTRRLHAEQLRHIVAATNMKQRSRKLIEYTHADRLQFGVAGTVNLLEHDQGFFVRLGDGMADIKPIAHLYKSQVYALAEFLDLPEVILTRIPTTDTYSLSQTQEEFFFGMSYASLDLIIYGLMHGIAHEEIADALGIDCRQLAVLIRDIEQKRRATRGLHLSALMLAPVSSAGKF